MQPALLHNRSALSSVHSGGRKAIGAAGAPAEANESAGYVQPAANRVIAMSVCMFNEWRTPLPGDTGEGSVFLLLLHFVFLLEAFLLHAINFGRVARIAWPILGLDMAVLLGRLRRLPLNQNSSTHTVPSMGRARGCAYSSSRV